MLFTKLKCKMINALKVVFFYHLSTAMCPKASCNNKSVLYCYVRPLKCSAHINFDIIVDLRHALFEAS